MLSGETEGSLKEIKVQDERESQSFKRERKRNMEEKSASQGGGEESWRENVKKIMRRK